MKNFLTAVFASEEALLTAARELSGRHIPIFDAFTPYPIHELDKLLGIRRSRLPLVCFAAGLVGFSLALGFQFWAYKIDWPIIVGGKPFNSFPAFMPVTFECTVLIGGLVTVAAWFLRDRLFPGKKPTLPHINVTDHQFVLAILHDDASLDGTEVRKLLLESGAQNVEEKGDEVVRALALISLFFMLLVPVACERDSSKPGYEIPFMTNMKYPIPFEAYSEHEELENGMTLQTPVEGTIPRGTMITLPKENPLEPTAVVLDRGRHMYETYCLLCHGVSGEGDGPMIPKYPNPPGLKTRKMMALRAPEIFTAMTYGKKDMPAHGGQIEEEDRWALIHYFQTLQGKPVKGSK